MSMGFLTLQALPSICLATTCNYEIIYFMILSLRKISLQIYFSIPIFTSPGLEDNQYIWALIMLNYADSQNNTYNYTSALTLSEGLVSGVATLPASRVLWVKRHFLVTMTKESEVVQYSTPHSRPSMTTGSGFTFSPRLPLAFSLLVSSEEVFWLPWQRLPRKLDLSIFPVIRVLWATFMPNFMELGPQTVKIDFGLTFALYYINMVCCIILLSCE